MSQCATKLQLDSKKTPSLRRIALFLKKLVDTKCISFEPAPRASRVFCLGDFIFKKAPPTTEMEMETPEPSLIGNSDPIIATSTDNGTLGQTESVPDATMEETSPTANDQ